MARMQKTRANTQEVLIIKSKALGEMDRMVTLVSQEKGRFIAVAKGVRKLTSKQKSALESGGMARVYLIERAKGQAWPLVTQASCISDCREIRGNLVKIRQLMQFLEIVDKLIVEMELESEIWQKILLIRELIVGCEESDGQKNGLIKKKLEELVIDLGFQAPEKECYQSVMDYVADLTGQKMKSWRCLDVTRMEV